ncbi:MAG: hypothetical protein ACLGSD_10370 [Acidobacteriota bacterium]
MGTIATNLGTHGVLPRITPALIFAVAATAAAAPASQPLEPAQQLVREVVYNELHDHDAHGYWRYWIRASAADGAQLSEVVETHAGPIKRVMLNNGRPPQNSDVELAKLEALANSSDAQASHRQAYAQDENRVRRILGMLPDAFCFDDLGEQNGIRHLRFHPNPAYSAHTVEGRVFHALTGDLWIDARMKRMTRIEGRLNQDLNFGFGLLGRVNNGSWFRMQRRQVSPTEWKTAELDIHMSGRAVIFKTIARDTHEVRGGFARVPADWSVAQSIQLLEQLDPGSAAELAPVAFTRGQ